MIIGTKIKPKKKWEDLKEHLITQFSNSTSWQRMINLLLKRQTVFPKGNIFKFLEDYDFNNLRVVLIVPSVVPPFKKQPLAQDKLSEDEEVPYLTNMIKSINFNVYQSSIPEFSETFYFDKTLKSWLEQGVLILPVELVVDVESDEETSLRNQKLTGWVFKKIVRWIESEFTGIIFAYWGVKPDLLIDKRIHFVLTSDDVHDSKLFSEINNITTSCNNDKISWIPTWEKKDIIFSQYF